MKTLNSAPELPEDVTLKTIPLYRQPNSHRLLQAHVSIVRGEAFWDSVNGYSSGRIHADNSIFNTIHREDDWAQGDTGTASINDKTLIVPAHRYEISSLSGMPSHIIPVTKPVDMSSDAFKELLESKGERLCTLNVDSDRRQRLSASNSAQVVLLKAIMELLEKKPGIDRGRDQEEKIIIIDNESKDKNIQKRIEERVAEIVKANRQITVRRVFHETARVWQTLQFIGDKQCPLIYPMHSLMFPMANCTGDLQDAVRILRNSTHLVIYGQGDKVKLQ